MVLLHRQASGLFSFLEYRAQPGGDLNLLFQGDYIRNQVNTSALVKNLSFENHPLHLFLHDGKLAFLTKEVDEILDISKPTQSLRQSKVLEEGIDHATIPAISLGQGNNLIPGNVNQVSILYLSSFFLFVWRSNKPIAVPFTRWAIREAIPMALAKRQIPELTAKDLKLMELAAKHESLFARQLLIDRGFIEAEPKYKQLGFDDVEQGGADGT
jgi:hypothetical protein